MNITQNLKYFFILPAVLSIAAIVALAVWGLKPGIDLSGGSLLEVAYPAGRPPADMMRSATAGLGLGEVRVQPAGEYNFILRQRALSDIERQTLLQPLRN